MIGNFVLFAKHAPYSSSFLRNYCMDIARQQEYLTSARWLWDFLLAHMFLPRLWAKWVRAPGKEAKDSTGHLSGPWSLNSCKIRDSEEMILKVPLSSVPMWLWAGEQLALLLSVQVSWLAWRCSLQMTAVLWAVGLGGGWEGMERGLNTLKRMIVNWQP